MPVAVYKLRIRERADDDSAWHEARVVAASLPEALVQAEQRFGEEMILAIEQDAGATDAEATVDSAHDAIVLPPVRPEPLPEPALTFHADRPMSPDALPADTPLVFERVAEPMPWEGRWRPSVLLWIGGIAGLVLMTLWLNFGQPARDRFVTAKPGATPTAPGLELGGQPPPGGVLAATGVDLRSGQGDGTLGTMVGQTVAQWPRDDESGDPVMDGDAPIDEDTVRDIGTIVGDMFARWPRESQPDAPPYRPVPDYEEPAPSVEDPYDDGRLASLPPTSVGTRESGGLRPFYVEVLRSDNVTETLQVSAYDADHARQLVASQPGHPAIVRGPSTQLDW